MGFTFLRNIINVRRSRLHGEDGFTLIEVMVSAVIVVLLAASVAKALIASTDFSGYERYRSQADEVAQQDQERLKSMSDAQLANLDQTRNVAVGPTTYTLHSTATFLSSSGTSSCTSGNTAYFKVTSTVAWNATKGNPVHNVTEETIITRPVSGSLTLKVNDQAGNGLSGVTVTPTGTNTGYTTNGVTDPTGCAAFAGLPVDGYTLALSDTGYVDVDGNANPSEAASVNSTGVTAATQMVMGQAGSLNASFATWDATSGATPIAAPGTTVPGFELSYYGSGAGNHMTVFKTTGSTTVSAPNLSANNLFPFALTGPSYTNNYQVWAGSCPQEQPLQPPAGMDTASVTPGGYATPVVAEPAIDVAVKNNGSYVPPTDVKITFTGTSSNGTCTDTWSPVPQLTTEAVGPVTYYVYPAPFASTAAKGSANASATGDPGSIKVCVDYKTGASTYRKETSAAFTNTNFSGPTYLPTTMDLKLDGASLSGKC
jgi:prepilin-type N-terminal cleavage/methylation domain-containing protein